jgi:hypothetical protein
VGQREVVGDQARRELVHHRLDRQAAPPAVAEHGAALVGVHVLRAARGDDAHRLEVRRVRLAFVIDVGRQRLVAPGLAALEERADDGLERRPHARDEGVEVGERDARAGARRARTAGTCQMPGRRRSWVVLLGHGVHLVVGAAGAADAMRAEMLERGPAGLAWVPNLRRAGLRAGTDRDRRIEGAELGDVEDRLGLLHTELVRLHGEQDVALELQEESVGERRVRVGRGCPRWPARAR